MSELTATIDQVTYLMLGIEHLFTQIAATFTSIVGVFAMLASALPKPEEGSVALFVHRWVNRIGFNIGHAKNQD